MWKVDLQQRHRVGGFFFLLRESNFQRLCAYFPFVAGCGIFLLRAKRRTWILSSALADARIAFLTEKPVWEMKAWTFCFCISKIGLTIRGIKQLQKFGPANPDSDLDWHNGPL